LNAEKSEVLKEIKRDPEFRPLPKILGNLPQRIRASIAISVSREAIKPRGA